MQTTTGSSVQTITGLPDNKKAHGCAISTAGDDVIHTPVEIRVNLYDVHIIRPGCDVPTFGRGASPTISPLREARLQLDPNRPVRLCGQTAELCMAGQASHKRITLAAAARSFVPAVNIQVLRGALDRLGLFEKDERGHRVIPLHILDYLKSERRRSGYLHPRGARLPEILAACANGATAVETSSDTQVRHHE